MDIFTNELQVEEVQIIGKVRLGRREQKGDRNPRALLEKMTEVYDKWEVVKREKTLREARKEEYRRVYVVPDLTPKERSKERELREQLKEKKENGEGGWFIICSGKYQ